MGHALTTAVDDIFRNLLSDLSREHRLAAQAAVTVTSLSAWPTSPATTNGLGAIGAKLNGIHKLADEGLRPAFTDSEAYLSGMRRLADVEIGKAELSEILNLVGLTVLAIFCAPLAFAVGLVQAARGCTPPSSTGLSSGRCLMPTRSCPKLRSRPRCGRP